MSNFNLLKSFLYDVNDYVSFKLLKERMIANDEGTCFAQLIKEQGYYKYTTGSGVVEKKYTGGLFDLKDLEGKKFEIGKFSLEFKDWAGNSFTIANTTEVMDFTGATMATSTSTTVLPTPGFNVDQLVGSVGKIELKSSDAKDFDMASLYDGIPALGDLTAVNHVDITQGSHVLKLTMGDV
mgnify:CR=1 FL=1